MEVYSSERVGVISPCNSRCFLAPARGIFSFQGSTVRKGQLICSWIAESFYQFGCKRSNLRNFGTYLNMWIKKNKSMVRFYEERFTSFFGNSEKNV
jgi:hypothetical protein